MHFSAASEEEMTEIGSSIASTLKPNQIVALKGGLGAGKTTLAKGVISYLTGFSPDTVTSPTFQYVQTYQSDECIVFHFDLWRLMTSAEFFALGLDEFFDQGICLIEWPERIDAYLPEDTIFIEISGSQNRRIEIFAGRESAQA